MIFAKGLLVAVVFNFFSNSSIICKENRKEINVE